jgi:CheY-like chemotaxis protein
MSILIIDRDEHAMDQIAAMLDNHNIPYEKAMTRDQGIEKLRQQPYDSVIIDPAPQNEIRPFVMGARRMAKQYPYILMTSRTIDRQKALAGGCNELLEKPLDMAKVEQKVLSAIRLGKMIGRFGDESEDFPSKDGVIAKSAFNQLFLSCLDRADRYGEQSYMIFVAITNNQEILANDGPEAFEKCCMALKKNLARIRRLSDIAAQTAQHEFVLMLMRPQNDEEPFLACNRFAENLQEYHDLISVAPTPAEVSVYLFTAPSGDILVEHKFNTKTTNLL